MVAATALTQLPPHHPFRYTDGEMRTIWQTRLRCSAPAMAAAKVEAERMNVNPLQVVHRACDSLFELAGLVNEFPRRHTASTGPLGLRDLLRAVPFLANHGAGHVSFAQNVVLAGRYLLADRLQQHSGYTGVSKDVGESQLECCARKWADPRYQLLGVSRDAVLEVFGPPASRVCERPLAVLMCGVVRCEYGGLIASVNASTQPVNESARHHDATTCTAPCAEDVPATARLLRDSAMTFVPTMLTNVARIMAALSAKSALLLLGPPGTGKSFCACEVARILGHTCVRINFSASTTADQLFGCRVPRFTNGVPTFEFHDGPLTLALKKVGTRVVVNDRGTLRINFRAA